MSNANFYVKSNYIVLWSNKLKHFILFYSTNVLSSCFVDRFRCGGGWFSTVHVVSSS